MPERQREEVPEVPVGCPWCGSDDHPARVDDEWYCRDCGETWTSRELEADEARATLREEGEPFMSKWDAQREALGREAERLGGLVEKVPEAAVEAERTWTITKRSHVIAGVTLEKMTIDGPDTEPVEVVPYGQARAEVHERIEQLERERDEAVRLWDKNRSMGHRFSDKLAIAEARVTELEREKAQARAEVLGEVVEESREGGDGSEHVCVEHSDLDDGVEAEAERLRERWRGVGLRRYRILWDLDTGEKAQPCGVVVEHADHVQVVAPADKAFPVRIDEPYPELQRGLEVTHIYPGHPRYFDLACFDLGRSFALTGEFEVRELLRDRPLVAELGERPSPSKTQFAPTQGVREEGERRG